MNWIVSAVEPGTSVQETAGSPYFTRTTGAEGGAAAAGIAAIAASAETVNVRTSSFIRSPVASSDGRL